jgi:protein SCO1/2
MKKSRGLVWIIGIIALLFAAAVMAQDEDAADLRVTGAWARPGDEMSGAYLRIYNDGQVDEQLVAVHIPDGMAEIHETQMENDVMRMRPVDAITIPAGEMVALEPGGYHIMLMGFDSPLVEGDSLRLTLVFAAGAEVTVEAWVSQIPIPDELAPDALTDLSLDAVSDGIYVGQVVNPPVQVQDFAAPSSDPDLTQLSDTDGTWRVIFFGYMHCPDFCPLTLVDYRQAKALLGETANEVTFMFISVDSVRDTPEAVRRYLDNFDPAFVGFSPDDATLSRIQSDYGFYYERRLDEGTQAVYTIDHSTRSYLLDRDGVLRASFAYDTDPQQIADALLWYMENE